MRRATPRYAVAPTAHSRLAVTKLNAGYAFKLSILNSHITNAGFATNNSSFCRHPYLNEIF